jgi:hypothetical protein
MSFKTVNHLLFDKKDGVLSSEYLEEFNPYITRKAFSFYDNGKFADLVNDTLNVYSNIFEDNVQLYKFYDNIIPQLKRKRIEYFKKDKNDSDILEERGGEFY